MSASERLIPAGDDGSANLKRLIAGTLIFLLVAAVGLFFVKWNPYWHKAHAAAVAHSIGSSIVSGKTPAAPPVGIRAAWSYALAYYNAVWEAIVLALLLGASIQVFVPRRWLHNLIGRATFGSTALAGAFSLAGMM